MTNEPRERVGPYRVEGALGKGGMGEVFRGFDERLERQVALKRLRPDGVRPESRARFRREAKAIARFNHASIVQIHDWVEEESGDWIVMELVDGRSLRSLIGTGLSLKMTLAVAQDIAAGLAVAHRAGVIHRDLKPENVMVTEGGAKILDFGLAKEDPLISQESSLTVDGRVLGTSSAMAPEQALGRQVDFRCDLFSFGSLIYEMVTGISPFRAETGPQTLARICSLAQTPVEKLKPNMPMALSRLIDELLAKDPAKRPGSAAEVQRSLKSIEEDLFLLSKSSDPVIDGPPREEMPETISGDQTLESGLLSDPLPPSLVLSTESSALGEGHLPAGQESAASGLRNLKPELWRRRPSLMAMALAGALFALLGWLFLPGARPLPGAGTMEREGAEGAEKIAESEEKGLLLARHLEVMDERELFEHGMELLGRYDKKGYIEASIEAFQRVLALNPESAPGHAGLARAYAHFSLTGSKDPDWLNKAESIAEEAVALEPFLAHTRISRGFVAQLRGRFQVAEEDFLQALELDPLSVPAHLGLARIYQNQDQLRAAEEILEACRELAPGAWRPAIELGGLLYQTGRYEQALKVFQEVVALVPDSSFGYRNLSATYYALGDLAQASKFLQKALEIQPTPTLYSNLGTLYFAQGLYSKSVLAFEKAIESPGGVHDYRAWAFLGDAYRWAPGRRGEAAGAYRQALRLLDDRLIAQPANLVLRSRRALYLAKSERCAESALEREGLSSSSSDSATHYRLAVMLELCGERRGALLALEEALGHGYSEADMKSDPELLQLREDPEYHLLLSRLVSSG